MKTKELTREFYRKNTLRFVMLAVFGLGSDALSLMISPLLMEITDIIADGKGIDSLKAAAFKTLFVFASLFVTGTIFAFFNGRFIKNALVNYKERVMKLITQKDIYAFKGESGAVYISALTNDATSIENGYLKGIINMISQSFLFLGALFLMIRASLELTLITIGLLMVPVAVSVLTGKSLVKLEKETSEKNAGFVAGINEILRGFSVVKCFKSEKEVGNMVCESNRELEEVKCKKTIITTVIGFIGSLAGGSTQFGLFLIGALIAIKNGNITAGTLLLFVNLLNHLLAPINSMPSLIAGIQASKALIKKMADNLSAKGEEGVLEIGEKETKDIEIRNLSFAYEEGKEVLHGINADFKEGRSYALVGGSGSGKSTVLKLLMNSYDNYGGSIRVSDKEIKDIKTGSLYDTMSLIEQEVFVFNSTIRENITMFKEFAKEKIDDAIEKAGLSELIQSKGEEYLCGENGCNLSGGERQRISIARSLLLGNGVLLVDEATAALDAQTAFKVTNSILDLEGKTKIVVTHDLDAGTLSRFDEIITLKNGQIEESGSFEELMDKKEYFYSLFTIAQ